MCIRDSIVDVVTLCSVADDDDSEEEDEEEEEEEEEEDEAAEVSKDLQAASLNK